MNDEMIDLLSIKRKLIRTIKSSKRDGKCGQQLIASLEDEIRKLEADIQELKETR